MKFEQTTTIGRTSAGKRIFFIKLPWIIRTFDDSKEEEENQTQGNTPQKRKRE
jgi:hypothetical protein